MSSSPYPAPSSKIVQPGAAVQPVRGDAVRRGIGPQGNYGQKITKQLGLIRK
jgi:hypothetical protein